VVLIGSTHPTTVFCLFDAHNVCDGNPTCDVG
jgi:hypothetical protein